MELGLAHDNQAFFFYSEFKKERVEMSGIRLQPRVPQKDWWLLFKMMEQWRDHYYSIEDIHWADRFPEEIQEFIVEMAIVHGSVK